MKTATAALFAPRGARVLIGVLAVAFFVQAMLAAGRKSLTWDEPTVIASGYSYLTTGDYRLDPEAPPLAQELSALPLLWLDLKPPVYDVDFAPERQYAFAARFIRANAERIRELSFWARFPVWCLGALLVVLCGSWSLRLYGPASAVLTAFLVAVSPNLLAHGRLATTDFACSVGMLGAVYTFWWALRRGRSYHAGVLGFVTGLVFLAKYTALLLVPIFAVLSFYEWYANRVPASRLLRILAVAAAVAFVVVTLDYGRPLDPRPYLSGLSSIYVHNSRDYDFYLLGSVSENPLWYYHIVAFLIKTPIPTLVLIAIALRTLLLGDRRGEAAVYLLVPAAAVMVVSCFDVMNIGLRRILPAYPFLFVFAGQALARPPSRLGGATLAVLLLWLTAEAVLIFPNHLSYFNVAVGGPGRGPWLMDDSNLDWGQDLPALAAWQRENAPDEPLHLRYFGTAPPAAYGVKSLPMSDADIVRPRAGLYAVSAHVLVWFRKVGYRSHRDIDWLSHYKPIGRAGYSIYIYRFE